MTTNRHQLLRTLIDNPNTTPAEREAAQRALNVSTGVQIGQKLMDSELEQYLSPNRNLRSSDLFATRQQYSQATQQILTDIGDPLIGLVPPSGAMERLTELLSKTSSEVVKSRVRQALQDITYLSTRRPHND